MTEKTPEQAVGQPPPTVDYLAVVERQKSPEQKLRDELERRKQMCIHFFNRCYAEGGVMCRYCMYADDCNRERTLRNRGGEKDE